MPDPSLPLAVISSNLACSALHAASFAAASSAFHSPCLLYCPEGSPYGKGGAAFENSNVSATCFNPQGGAINVPNLCVNQAGTVFANGAGFATSSTRVGWTIGYGAEFDLGRNWSAKAEYDYLSFGRHTALASDGTTIMSDRSDISQVKVGLNYRFTPATAVIAKY